LTAEDIPEANLSPEIGDRSGWHWISAFEVAIGIYTETDPWVFGLLNN
jgi:hypothetical protein